LKAKINSTTGLFLFDTGAEISFVNEKFIVPGNLKTRPETLTDAKGIKQTKHLYKILSFKLGDVEFKDLEVYPEDSLCWIDPKGIHFNQDTVIGVIGNNIISKFIWDFDLVNKRVTISKSESYCDSIPDSLAIGLVTVEKHKEIIVRINGKLKRLTLDFGSAFPISLSGSIPNQEASDTNDKYFQNTKSAFNHLIQDKTRKSICYFADIQFGSYQYKDIQCFENDHSALFGIPFIWSFKRVIVDYLNNEVYFIKQHDYKENYNIKEYTRDSINNGYLVQEIVCKPTGLTFILENKANTERYKFYGKLKIYKNLNKMDSIYVADSVRLPEGKIKYGPATMVITSERVKK
jgi:hypothetical protein